MSRLVIVSNRVASPRERGAKAGGLAVALQEALSKQGGLWFGWSGEIAADAREQPLHLQQAGAVNYATLDLTQDEYNKFYLGFSNSTLWPLFHYRLGLIDYSRDDWNGYLSVNVRVAQALAGLIRPNDLIWIHDYHFLPLADQLRKLGLRNRIGFFLHIPFPAPEVLQALPGHRTLVRALMAYDLLGFQTERDAGALRHYLLQEAAGVEIDRGRIRAFGQMTTIDVFPIGIDAHAFAKTAMKAENAPETLRLTASLSGRALGIGVDRLDYTKGLPARFRAFEHFWDKHPEWRSKVTMMQIAPVSRGEVREYRTLRRELESLAGHINSRYAEFDWVPIRYLNRSFSRKTLAGFYRCARLGLVTPFRDGMNLVAKEYVAAQRADDPGVLILSEMAGAAAELEGALTVNPFDQEAMIEAMNLGLQMPREERIARWRTNMQSLEQNSIAHWRESFLHRLSNTRSHLTEVALVG